MDRNLKFQWWGGGGRNFAIITITTVIVCKPRFTIRPPEVIIKHVRHSAGLAAGFTERGWGEIATTDINSVPILFIIITIGRRSLLSLDISDIQAPVHKSGFPPPARITMSISVWLRPSSSSHTIGSKLFCLRKWNRIFIRPTLIGRRAVVPKYFCIKTIQLADISTNCITALAFPARNNIVRT